MEFVRNPMELRRAGTIICLVLFGAVLLAGCGPTDADFNKVEIGMSTEEVKAIMGEPQRTKVILGAAEQWVYKETYVVQFALDKVIIKEKR